VVSSHLNRVFVLCVRYDCRTSAAAAVSEDEASHQSSLSSSTGSADSQPSSYALFLLCIYSSFYLEISLYCYICCIFNLSPIIFICSMQRSGEITGVDVSILIDNWGFCL